MLPDLLDVNLQMDSAYIFWIMLWIDPRGIALICSLYKTEIYTTGDFIFKVNFSSKKTIFYHILTENPKGHNYDNNEN